MQILILYYSKGGNTRRLAEAIAGGVDAVEGVNALIKNTSDVTKDDFAGCDGIDAGSPAIHQPGLTAQSATPVAVADLSGPARCSRVGGAVHARTAMGPVGLGIDADAVAFDLSLKTGRTVNCPDRIIVPTADLADHQKPATEQQSNPSRLVSCSHWFSPSIHADRFRPSHAQ